MTPRQEALVERIVQALRENEEPAPSVIIAKMVGVPKQAVDELLAHHPSEEIVRFGESGFGLRSWAMAILGGAQVLFQEEVFGPRDLRNELGVTRRVVMDLLDFWKSEGLVEKTEDGWAMLLP
jgi:hypothetical protein